MRFCACKTKKRGFFYKIFKKFVLNVILLALFEKSILLEVKHLVRYRICRAYVVGTSSTLSKRELTRSRPSVGENKIQLKMSFNQIFSKN